MTYYRRFGEPIRRAAWLVVLLVAAVTSLGTTFNALQAVLGRAASLIVGKPLVDDEQPNPPSVEWRRVASHEYQKQLERFAVLNVPERPFLVRLHNEILFSMFETSPRPNIVIGARHFMIEQIVVNGYCQRSFSAYLPRLRRRVEQVSALQKYFEARQRAFLFVITPSKMAHMPDLFLDKVDCPALPAERDALIPTFVKLLEDAGIHVVDAASLMDDLRNNGITPYPVGGIHWNMLAAAYGAQAIIRRLNQTASRPLLPELRWTTRLSDGPLFEDDDLTVGLELLRDPPYPSTHVAFAPSGPCPAGQLSVSIIGTSCSVQLVRALSATQCISRGRYFARLTRRYVTFPPERETPGPIRPDFIAPLIDADVVILEENENAVGFETHVGSFYDLTFRRQPSAPGAAKP